MDRYRLVYKGSPPDHCCCDSTLRILPNGDWAVVFMTGGEHEPRKENYIALCRSKDRGASWGELEVVLRYDDRACLLTEVVVHDGVVTVHAVEHDGHFGDWKNYLLRSSDSGASWSEPVTFGALPRRAFVRNLVVTSWGEWLLPYQVYDQTEDWAVSPLDEESILGSNGVLISGDEGKTWEDSQRIGPTRSWPENNVVELSDGRLVMLARADGQGYLLRSESRDRGRSWSAYELTDIPNPGTKFRLFRMGDGRIVLLHNPNENKVWYAERNPLALWVSDDDMATWSEKRVLTDFPGQLQYPDGVLDEEAGCVHFAFDYNRHDVIFWSAKLPE